MNRGASGPPGTRQSPRAAGFGAKQNSGDSQSITAQRFVVTIDAGDRCVVWGYYDTHADGEAIARRLRVHGFHAVTTDTREATR